MPVNKKTTTKARASVKKIKKAIEPVEITPQKIAKVGKLQLRDFIDFIRTQGAVGLAIGLVLGGSVSTMVKSLVDDIVMPPLGLILGSAEGIKGLSFAIGKANGQIATVRYGIFLNDFINFIVIALVVYFIVKLLKIEKLDKKK